MRSEQFLHDWTFMNFSRWVPLWVYLLFVLPLFTLSYASGAFGAEREGRTLVWLLTRPLPRSAVYLAEFVGTLPWCLAFSVGGFVLLCAVGGPPGREALRLYWPAAVAGTVAFAALFHLIGAVFRRPVVVGLVYVFFYEALVLSLPGSLKLLSLTFYTRCLMYNGAAAAGYPVEMLDVTGPVSATTAWAVLLSAAAGLTGLGMWLFARREHPDDV
jgi:ABC-type transport system involved in multi-copper enzyme maturation permease subunit